MESLKLPIYRLFVLTTLLVLACLVVVAMPFHAGQTFFYWLLGAVLLVLGLNGLSFSSTFTRHKHPFIFLAILSAIAVPFLFGFYWLQIIGMLAIAGGVYQGWRSVRKSEAETLTFSYYRSVRPGMTIFMLSLIFLAALNVYIRTSERLQEDPDLFYESMADVVVESSRPLLVNTVDGFSFTMTLNEFLATENKFTEAFFASSNGQVDDADARSEEEIAQARRIFSKEFDVKVEGNEAVQVVLREIVSERLRHFFGPIEPYVPLLYALLLFLSLRFAVPIVVWIAAGLGSVIFKYYLQTGRIVMKKKNVEVDVPELKSV